MLLVNLYIIGFVIVWTVGYMLINFTEEDYKTMRVEFRKTVNEIKDCYRSIRKA